MSYATPTELRERFMREMTDEFVTRPDAELQQALDAASREIDSYRPAGTLSTAAAGVLTEQCLVLARLLVHNDAALDGSHPIVRDARAVREWLRDLARGTARLPDDTDASAGSGAQWAVNPTVWGRGEDGGL